MNLSDEPGASRLRAMSRRLRGMSWPEPPTAAPRDAPAARSLTFDGAEVDTPRGSVLVLSHRLDEADPHWARVAGAVSGQLDHPRSNLRRLLACSPVPGARAEDLLFVDIETTGLEVLAPLFLIGTLQWDGEGFVVRQALARNYDEEAAAIGVFHAAAARAQLLVSFNGKTFDLPFLRARAAANRLPPSPRRPHLDLLPLCRRAWRARLPNCRLTTLEVHVCGRERHDDLPGSAIPETYHEYVRTSNPALILPVLEHNVVDLGTMADLMLRLPAD